MPDHFIRRARAAQHHASRALLRHGLTTHTRTLLLAAALAADAALSAGHRVHDLHHLTRPPQQRGGPRA